MNKERILAELVKYSENLIYNLVLNSEKKSAQFKIILSCDSVFGVCDHDFKKNHILKSFTSYQSIGHLTHDLFNIFIRR